MPLGRTLALGSAPRSQPRRLTTTRLAWTRLSASQSGPPPAAGGAGRGAAPRTPFHPGLGMGADLGQGSIVRAQPEAAATIPFSRSVGPSSHWPGVPVSSLPSVYSWPASPPPGLSSKKVLATRGCTSDSSQQRAPPACWSWILKPPLRSHVGAGSRGPWAGGLGHLRAKQVTSLNPGRPDEGPLSRNRWRRWGWR